MVSYILRNLRNEFSSKGLRDSRIGTTSWSANTRFTQPLKSKFAFLGTAERRGRGCAGERGWRESRKGVGRSLEV